MQRPTTGVGERAQQVDAGVKVRKKEISKGKKMTAKKNIAESSHLSVLPFFSPFSSHIMMAPRGPQKNLLEQTAVAPRGRPVQKVRTAAKSNAAVAKPGTVKKGARPKNPPKRGRPRRAIENTEEEVWIITQL